MKGQVDLDMSDHLVIVGYAPGAPNGLSARSPPMMPDLLLCALGRTFRRTQCPTSLKLDSFAVILPMKASSAGVHCAARVLIDARDDNEALAVTVAVTHVNPRGTQGGHVARHEPCPQLLLH